MKIKLTTLLFGLLLAVGWTSNASAQALPEGNFTKRLGLPEVGVNADIVNAKRMASMPVMAMPTGESTQMNAPAKAPNRVTGVSDVVKNKAYYQQFKYNWTDGEGDTAHVYTNVDPTEPASNPYQIYELLRFIYGNPNFPGPTYSAYTPAYQREDEVYYGPIAGGWNISSGSGGATVNTQDITITASNYYASISSIQIYNAENGAELVNWDAATEVNDGNYSSQTSSGTTYYYFNLPNGWSSTHAFGVINVGTNDDPIYTGYIMSGEETAGSLTIPYSAFNGATTVRVVINACSEEGYTSTLTVNNGRVESLTSTLTDYTWDNITVAETPQEGAFVQGTVVAPKDDGYTVVLVALKNKEDMTLETELWPANSTHYETKAQLITYFRNNIEYVRLLTDGLRIGQGRNTGTVFNADGRLNRFFFLGKGQARKKAKRVLEFINQGGNITFSRFSENGTYYTTVNYQDWFGEDVPFEEMFEQFSPTSATLSDESQTTDLFDRLKEGNVYKVQHDCGSVMQAEHEFSLSGKNGTDYFAFSGLNFFVPDYRLLFFDTTYTYSGTQYTIDGRDNTPAERANTSYTTPDGSHGANFTGIYDLNSGYTPTWRSAWSCYYANYHKTYAPKIGIYRITLDATAEPASNYSTQNRTYNVTLTWVSSLNEMSGNEVPQTYTVYLVDEDGNRTELHPTDVKFYDAYGNELNESNQNPFQVTQAVYAVPQNEHSYTIEYIVHGKANQSPAFEAWSNTDDVIIPGWNDFVGLQLDHHESDFDPNASGKRVNWYRNFLAMVNEDILNGLTVSKITGYNGENQPATTPMDKFNLYRFLYNDQGQPGAQTKIATVTFDQATSEKVHFTVAYEDNTQNIEPYELDGTSNAYSRANLGIPESGYVRVKGNGDIVIWPNRYSVNIKSITIKNGNSTVASWSASSANFNTNNPNLPTSPYKWDVSPGSEFLPFTTSTTNEKVCYMSGGGYLYIEGILNDYPNATVVIEAFGEAGNVNRIMVNDHSQNIYATAGGTTYTWQTLSPNAAPRRAGETMTVTEDFEDTNTFPTFGLGGITSTQHTGAFGDWTIYDSTGSRVWGSNDFTWTNTNEPQAWMPFNGNTVGNAEAHSGVQYIESVCPASSSIAANSWLISPELSGNAQTITFWARIFTTKYTPETFEVLYTTSGIDRSNFANSVNNFTLVQSYSSSTETWTKYEVELPANAKHFAIRHTSLNIFGLMVDDVTYEISTPVITPTEGGLLRLHLLMADQFKEEIKEDNSHPDKYGYVLKFEPENGDTQQSGIVDVRIQKTDCEVMGYYTLDQIDRDTNRGLTMDILTADVDFNLSATNDKLNYYYLQSKEDALPGQNQDYVTQLHRQENFTYREMLTTSPDFDQVYDAGEHHYFNSTAEPVIGEWNNANKYVSYVPSVSTWGIERRYFEDDGLDNTYGGPIWKTAVGKAEMNSVTAERQKNVNNSVNWTDENGKAASLYILDNIDATGYLPPSNLTKVEFEPYMFRVFVESKNGKLRNYEKVDADPANTEQPGEHLVGVTTSEEESKGPWCVWSGYVKYGSDGKPTDDPENGVEITNGTTAGSFIYHKDKVDRTGGSNANPLGEWDKDAANAMFGALDDLTTEKDDQGNDVIIEDDLKFFVRFYFAVKGEIADHTPWTRVEGSRSGNGAESAGKSGGSATAVNEIHYLGEIASQTYYNVQGMQSDKPFDGVNIVVTRFSDGTTTVTKVVK